MKAEIKTSLDIVQDWRRNTKIAYDKWLKVADEIAWLESRVISLENMKEILYAELDEYSSELLHDLKQELLYERKCYDERLAQLKSATQQDGDAE